MKRSHVALRVYKYSLYVTAMLHSKEIEIQPTAKSRSSHFCAAHVDIQPLKAPKKWKDPNEVESKVSRTPRPKRHRASGSSTESFTDRKTTISKSCIYTSTTRLRISVFTAKQTLTDVGQMLIRQQTPALETQHVRMTLKESAASVHEVRTFPHRCVCAHIFIKHKPGRTVMKPDSFRTFFSTEQNLQ